MQRLLAILVVLQGLQATAFALTLEGTWCDVNAATRLTVDTESHLVYVTSPLDHKIVVFNAGGFVVNTIELDGPPGAIELADAGNLIVSIGRTVRKISPDGTTLVTYGLAPNYFVDPHDVMWVPDGRVYVSDDDDVVKVFDDAGAPLFTFGSYGYFYGRFDEPVALEHNVVTGEIIVVDQNNYRFQAFDLEGDSLRHWGTEGNGLYADGAFFRPFGLDVDERGRIWVLDVLVDLVQVFDSSGVFLFSTELNTPDMRAGLDIAVDGEVLYVTSPSTNCVYVYSSSGRAIQVSPPLELTILWTEAGALLRWKPQFNAAGYHILRSADHEFTELSTVELCFTTDTVFTDPWSPNPRDLLYYRVIPDNGTMSPGLSEPFDPRAVSDDFARTRDPLDTPHDSPHHVTEGVNCNSCHLRPYDYPSPRPEWWFGDHLCKSCHVETGFAVAVQTHLGPDSIACRVCHSPHYHQPQFPRYFIRNENPMGESNCMCFNHEGDYIHGAPNYDGICEICHTQTNYYRNDGSDGGTHNVGSNCTGCHKHENGFMPVGGGACNSCHGAPPETGAHRAHFGGTAEQASYGTVQNLSTDSSYVFSCGTCHPSSSSSFHQNGQVDVELYDAGAPGGSLKALNPANAHYDETSGSCSNVYCHSATTWASEPVGPPLYDNTGRPILDANGNLTYDPYLVNVSRSYSVADWNGDLSGCNSCHRNGPQTSYSSVSAGVGNSHAWIDDWGYEDLHAWNMASDPLTCRSCHYGTVTAEQTWSRDVWDITTYDDVALISKARHINGQKDVIFDSVNTVQVQEENFSLVGATYDESSRTCSGIPCHMAQTTPEWGKPYRWWDTAECDQCHNMTGWFTTSTTLELEHEPLNGRPCTQCHDPHVHR